IKIMFKAFIQIILIIPFISIFIVIPNRYTKNPGGSWFNMNVEFLLGSWDTVFQYFFILRVYYICIYFTESSDNFFNISFNYFFFLFLFFHYYKLIFKRRF